MATFNYDLGTGAVATQGAPQASANQVQVGNMGVSGGAVEGATGVRNAPAVQAQVVPNTGPSQGDRTLDAILGIGKGIIDQKLKEQQNKAFLGGVQKAMQGEALKDIVDEQPWYTQIFGASSTVQGARAYTQIANVDKFTSSLYGDMDRLQKMDPSQVGEEVNGRMSQFLTGDEATDTAIQMKMIDSVGPFFKAQAKENYKWNQTNMQTQVSNAMLSASDNIQAAAGTWASGTSTAEDRKKAIGGAISSWQPLPGQSPASYWEAVKQATITSMAKGNHYMAQAVWSDQGGGSLFDSAPADVQLDLLNARETYEARTKAKEGTLEFGAEMGRIQGLMSTGQLSPQAGIQAMENVNTQFRLKTGIDGDIYDKADVAKFVQQDYKAYYSAAKEAAKARAEGSKPQQLLNEQVSSSRTATMFGNAQGALDSGVPRQVVDNTFLAVLQTQAEGGMDPNALIVKNYNGAGNGGSGYVNKALQNNMLSGLYASQGGYTPLLDQSVKMYDAIKAQPGGDAAATAYFGAENVVKINNYKKFAGTMAPELAWQASFGQPVNTLQTTPKAKIQKQLLETVQGDQPGMINRFFTGSTALTKNNTAVLATLVGKNYDILKSQLGVDESVAFAQAMNLSKDQADIVGPYAYVKTDPSQKSVAAMIGASPEAAGQAFADFFAQKANAAGYKLPAGNPKPNQKLAEYTNLFGGKSTGKAPWEGVQTTNFWEQWGKDDTDSVSIIRGADITGPDGNVSTTFFMVGTTAEGKLVQLKATNRELREFYEAQPYFK
ncbi:internal virion protein [Pseudomonas phage vB_PpuP-Vanda]